jgi:hypothetical protein
MKRSYFLLDPLVTRKMTRAMNPTTSRTPTQTPALKISPINWQLLNKKIEKIRKIEMVFFIKALLSEYNTWYIIMPVDPNDWVIP